MVELNLGYRLKRFLTGRESGIVEKIEPCLNVRTKIGFFCFKTARFNYLTDDIGDRPRLVTFRNPLGELVQELTPLVGVFNTEIADYQRYKPGDEFPGGFWDRLNYWYGTKE